jgi:hypothetical protein
MRTASFQHYDDAAKEKRWQEISIDRSDIAYDECVMRSDTSKRLRVSSCVYGIRRRHQPSSTWSRSSDRNSSAAFRGREDPRCVGGVSLSWNVDERRHRKNSAGGDETRKREERKRTIGISGGGGDGAVHVNASTWRDVCEFVTHTEHAQCAILRDARISSARSSEETMIRKHGRVRNIEYKYVEAGNDAR